MKKTILCIDDVKTSLSTIENIIRIHASDIYDIITAISASKALEILRTKKIDIILLDIMMPDIDGFELAKSIKSNQKTENIPIIFLTAKTDNESIKECYDIGASDYVAKPFKSVELLKRISFHIDLKEQERKLKESLEYVQTVLDSCDSLIIVTNTDTQLNANQAFLDFFNVPSVEAFNQQYGSIANTFKQEEEHFSLVSAKDEASWMQEVMQHSQSETVMVKISKTARDYSFKLNIKHFQDKYIIALTDMTTLYKQLQNYKYEANYDRLTQVYNRNMFDALMDKKISLAKRERKSFVFAILDIDFFKDINDTYGHLVGDEVLYTLAKFAQNQIRESDIFARWGGEEFAIILDTDIEDGFIVIDNLRQKLQEHIFETVTHLTCSFGVSSFKEGDTKEKLLKRADNALYKSKISGRNRVSKI